MARHALLLLQGLQAEAFLYTQRSSILAYHEVSGEIRGQRVECQACNMGDALQEDAIRTCVWEFIKLGALKVHQVLVHLCTTARLGFVFMTSSVMPTKCLQMYVEQSA